MPKLTSAHTCKGTAPPPPPELIAGSSRCHTRVNTALAAAFPAKAGPRALYAMAPVSSGRGAAAGAGGLGAGRQGVCEPDLCANGFAIT